MSRLFCVVVSFNPNIEYFKKVLFGILENEVSVVVVDNGSENISEIIEFLPTSVDLLSLGANVGIAKAQNLGIKNAFDAGAEYIWLSDQDTIYPSNFAFEMMSVISSAEDDGLVVGAIGPSFFELNRQRVEAFVRFSPWSRRFQPEKGLNKVAHLIASGMIISKKAFQAIGPKREDLFIDWVDLEWCWRANAKGYQVYGTGDVIIEHNLGDLMVKVANKQISIRSPFRHYFIIRNGLYLCLHDNLLPFPVRGHYFFRTLLFAISYPMLSPSKKWQHLKVNVLGLWHGIIGRLGPKP
ncbi:glycosyltransferase family 2 protein [Marinomonas foliarum]|uniref:Glycosyltransferase family 2 protein n=1 Tax=Marinomonas foliarum TaxID=491950 RepID=A0ABX7IT61_9GAMM|nr:glycosyltransferase family 2 protein [Marinomonas foliarum]QRV25176.1 glycosyltransferase family 2 protein [Marinomonas foliarum]